MALKIKKQNPVPVKLSFGVGTMLTNLLPAFKTPTYGDMQKIDSVIKTIAKDEQARFAKVQEIFKKHQIPEGESIDGTHPLFKTVNEEIAVGSGQITQADIALYSLEELNAAIEGINFNYSERKLLEFWLVKPAIKKQ